jgi:hypothetical protein
MSGSIETMALLEKFVFLYKSINIDDIRMC